MLVEEDIDSLEISTKIVMPVGQIGDKENHRSPWTRKI